MSSSTSPLYGGGGVGGASSTAPIKTCPIFPLVCCMPSCAWWNILQGKCQYLIDMVEKNNRMIV